MKDNQKQQSKHIPSTKEIIKDTLAVALSLASTYGMCLMCLAAIEGANWLQSICIVVAYSGINLVVILAFSMILTMETD